MRKFSNAFAHGFARGFSSPVYTYFNHDHHYTIGRSPVVASSWARVGTYLNNSTKTEAAKIEQTTKKATRERSH